MSGRAVCAAPRVATLIMMTATADESGRRMRLSKYVLALIARAVRRAIGRQPTVADVSLVLGGRLRAPVEKQHESHEDQQNNSKQHQFSFPWRERFGEV